MSKPLNTPYESELLKSIQSILHEKFRIKKALLEEKGTANNGNSFHMKRKIFDQGIPYLLYSYDSDTNCFPFFKDKDVSGLKKMCDYIFFVDIDKGDHLFVFLVELKLGTLRAKKQLEAGECFAKYILNTIKRLNLSFSLCEDCLHFRKIAIRESRKDRQKLAKDPKDGKDGIWEHLNADTFYIKEYARID